MTDNQEISIFLAMIFCLAFVVGLVIGMMVGDNIGFNKGSYQCIKQQLDEINK